MGTAVGGPGTLESQALPIRMSFPHKRALLQTEIPLSVISCPDGWSQTIPQVKKPVVDVMRGYTWSVVGSPVGRVAKLEAAYRKKTEH